MEDKIEPREGNYLFEERELTLVQITRRCRFTWEEAELFLGKNDCVMSRAKWFAAKKWLEESISARIMEIALTEYADVHLQLLDKSKEMFARMDIMAQEAIEENDKKLELKIYEETRQQMALIKELYNSNTIVAGVEKLVKEHIRKGTALQPHKHKEDSEL